MRKSETKRNLLAIIIMGLLLVIAAPTSFAQGRGHGRHNGRNGVWNNGIWTNDKKCGKFVNCHDARDGRWDGRGPRGNRVGNRIWRTRTTRNRDRNRNLLLQRRTWLRARQNRN
jgi:hypothetical protein